MHVCIVVSLYELKRKKTGLFLEICTENLLLAFRVPKENNMDDVRTRVSTGRDVPLSLFPGTKKISCPGVLLSRDKGRIKKPGTKSLSDCQKK